MLSGSVVCLSDGNQESPGTANNQRECQSLGLSGRLAVVTGGASRMGRSVCMILAREKAAFVIADTNRTGSNEILLMLLGPLVYSLIYNPLVFSAHNLQQLTYL